MGVASQARPSGVELIPLTKPNPTSKIRAKNNLNLLLETSVESLLKQKILMFLVDFAVLRMLLSLATTSQNKERKQDTNARIVMLNLHQLQNLLSRLSLSLITKIFSKLKLKN